MTASLGSIPARRARSNHAEVARLVGIDIIAGRFGGRAKLPGEGELMLRFGISRPVLRESVKTLAAKGLLTTKARVGTVVRERAAWNMFDADVLAWHLEAGISRDFLRDLSEIRLAIEPRAAALACARREETHLEAMRTGLAGMAALAPDSVAFAEADLDFHLAVAAASGNPFMRSIGAVVDAALRASFLLSAPRPGPDRDEVIRTHQRIIDAIAARQAEAAAAAMTEVILNGLRRHGQVELDG